MIIRLPVQMALCLFRGAGPPASEMGVQVSETGSYRPPVPRAPSKSDPPQISTRLPVQTADWPTRPDGAPFDDKGLQVSVRGSYRPPLSSCWYSPDAPPQTTMTFPVHTAEW